MEGHGQPRLKNGPALAGHGAEAVRDAIASTIVTLPEHLRRSLTWDQGAEMAQHAQLRIDSGLLFYVADHSRWPAFGRRRRGRRSVSACEEASTAGPPASTISQPEVDRPRPASTDRQNGVLIPKYVQE